MQTQHHIEDNICPVSVLLGSKEHYYTIYTIHLYLENFKGRARSIFCKQKKNKKRFFISIPQGMVGSMRRKIHDDLVQMTKSNLACLRASVAARRMKGATTQVMTMWIM